jgi:archaellum component FlaC
MYYNYSKGLVNLMNNDEKILEALNSIQGQMSDMNNKMDRISDQITKVEVHLENVTDKSIGLLMEQYNPNVDKLDDVINKVDEIQFDLGGIKRVLISHSKDINNLIKK